MWKFWPDTKAGNKNLANNLYRHFLVSYFFTIEESSELVFLQIVTGELQMEAEILRNDRGLLT